MTMEKKFSPMSGYLFVFIELVLLVAIVMAGMRGMIIPAIVLGLFYFLSVGFQIVNPNESAVSFVRGV